MMRRKGLIAGVMAISVLGAMLCGCQEQKKEPQFFNDATTSYDAPILDLTASADEAPETETTEADTTAPSEPDAPVLLVKEVNAYDESGNFRHGTMYVYDDQGRVDYTQDWDVETGKYVLSMEYSYDEQGKLLWAICGKPWDEYAPGTNSGYGYEYNDAGKLIKEYYWEGGGWSRTFRYDQSGKLIGSVDSEPDFFNHRMEFHYTEGTLPTGMTVTGYDLDDDWNEVPRNETCTFTYDDENRIIKKEYTGGQPDRTTTYNYDTYAPFVLIREEFHGEYTTETLNIFADVPTPIIQVDITGARVEKDDNGAVTTVTMSDGSYYEIRYTEA